MYQFTGSRDPVRLTPALNPAMTPEIWCKPLKGLTGAAVISLHYVWLQGLVFADLRG